MLFSFWQLVKINRWPCWKTTLQIQDKLVMIVYEKQEDALPGPHGISCSTVFLFLVKGIAKLLHQMKQDWYVFYFRPYSGRLKILSFEVRIKNMMSSHWKWLAD